MPEGSAGFPQRVVYRLSRRRRQTIVFLAVLLWALFIGLQVPMLILMPVFDSWQGFNFEDISTPLKTMIILDGVAWVFASASTTYGLAYWSNYRIVLDEQGIAREGAPHLFDRRIRIPYQEIASVTHGTYSVIRVIPRHGRVLATNPKLLEGGMPGLIQDLRDRLGPERVPEDLEKGVVTKHPADRLAIGLAVGVAPLLLFMLLSTFLGNKLLTPFGWRDIEPGVSDVLAIDALSDGSMWMLAESSTSERLLGATLIHVSGRETVRTELPQGPEVFGGLLANRIRFLLRGMAIDDAGHMWLQLADEEALYLWDGRAWSRIDPLPDVEGSAPDNLLRVAGEIWALSEGVEGTVRVDPTTGLGSPSPIQGIPEGGEETLTLLPERIFRAADGGATISGRFSSGGDGIARFDDQGTLRLLVRVDDSGLEPGPTWRLGYAAIDSVGDVYAIYHAFDVCQFSDWTLPTAILRHSTGEWQWSNVGEDAPCPEGAIAESFAVDLRGRIWTELSYSGRDHLFVYERQDAGEALRLGLIRHYTSRNSHYNGGGVRAMPDGRIVAITGTRDGPVFMDASLEQLPEEAPPWLAAIVNNPIILLFPYMLVSFIPVILSLRHNLGRNRSPGR